MSAALETAPQTMQRGRVLGVMLGHFVNDLHMSWLSVLLPPLVTRFQLSLVLAGLLGTMLNTSASIAQPLFGLMADRQRRAVLIAAGPVLTAAAMGLTGVLPSYGLVIAALLLAGTGTAAFHPQAAALSGFASGARRASGLAMFVTAGELAYALGPLYIAVVLQAASLSWTAAAAFPGFLAAAVLATRVRHWPTAPPSPHGTLAPALVRAWPFLLLLWTYVVVRNLMVLSLLTFLPLLLRQHGVSLLVGGTAVFLFGGIGAAGGMLGGLLANRVGRLSVLALSLLLSAPLLILYLRAPVSAGLLLLPLAGIAIYLSAPVTIMMAQEGMPQHAAVASSIVMGLAWAIGSLGLTAVGALADRLGLQQTLQLVVWLAGIGVLTVLGLSRTRLRPA